jgi:hypothetical protein
VRIGHGQCWRATSAAMDPKNSPEVEGRFGMSALPLLAPPQARLPGACSMLGWQKSCSSRVSSKSTPNGGAGYGNSRNFHRLR